jgi:hypothetical protein
MRNAMLVLVPAMLALLPLSGCSLLRPHGPTAWQVEGTDDPAMKLGPRSVENIENNIQRIRPRIDYFYESRIMPLSNRVDKVVVRLRIDRDGYVTSAAVSYSSINNREFEELIVKIITNHAFDTWDRGEEQTLVEYPFKLRKWYD